MLPWNGTISTSLSVIYSPSLNKRGIINNIKFNNTTSEEDWTLSLYQYNPNTRTSVLLYKRTLPHDESIDDNTSYDLPYGSKLLASSDTQNISYIINGVEINDIKFLKNDSLF